MSPPTMPTPDTLLQQQHSQSFPFSPVFIGGLFLDPAFPSSFARLVSGNLNPISSNPCKKSLAFKGFRRRQRPAAGPGGAFLSVSLKNETTPDGLSRNLDGKGEDLQEEADDANVDIAEDRGKKTGSGSIGALNSAKHLWAGAFAAMIARTSVAPLERLKLEYILRGEQKNILELVRTIAVSQGLMGFWKGNLVNILRTAPFKAINFYAYDTYRKHLHRTSSTEETTNHERFIAGAAAGITATVLCLPLDTIRTRLLAPGGENLGGVVSAFRHMIRTEGFFSLYKGLLPSIMSMAPSSAVFYGVYDILKAAYLHSPEGRRRIYKMKLLGQDLSVLGQLELGPVRTLLCGAIAGACAEAATYPFEVLRRQLQMQVRPAKFSTLATFVKIVDQGGVSALYAGLIPSLLQVLPSAAISYFVYEFMKIVLKVE